MRLPMRSAPAAALAGRLREPPLVRAPPRLTPLPRPLCTHMCSQTHSGLPSRMSEDVMPLPMRSAPAAGLAGRMHEPPLVWPPRA